jgi:hypothetical protein
MATLQSPGVSVSVIDESFYTPAGAGTVPMIFVATGQDKPNGAGTGIAQGTTAANAGKIWVITSQRDLTDTFGTPYFETDAEGNAVHGGELNEYGLQAAYSALGVSSKAYIVRADVDLSSLQGVGTVPNGTPVDKTYWVNTAGTTFGINEWNLATGKFTVKTPKIIDNTNVDSDYDTGANLPSALFGGVGEYAMVLTSDNGVAIKNALYYKTSTGWVAVTDTFDGGKTVTLSPHFDYPDYTASGLNADTGSIWIKTTSPGRGSSWDLRVYNASTGSFDKKSAPLYASRQAAIAGLDSVTGGQGIPLGSVFVEYDYEQNDSPEYQLHIRYKSGPTSVTQVNTTPTNQPSAFTIRETLASGAWSNGITMSFTTSTTITFGEKIAASINSTAGFQHTSAEWNPALNRLTITHALGGDIEINETQNQPFSQGLGWSGGYENIANLYLGPDSTWILSNWKPLVYEAQDTTPTTAPDNGQVWFNTELDVDIMYNNGTIWQGYGNAFPGADPFGPIVSASTPTTQQDGLTPLANGDIWINTSEPDMYGRDVYVYDGNAWALQDVTDHDTPDGWIFQDARWATTSTTSVASDIADLMVSNYVDPDCPDPKLYPRGTRLWNTRRSGNNVKKYVTGFINVNTTNERFNDESMINYFPDRWVTESPNDYEQVGQFGRKAQRSVVVQSLKALITANQGIRDTDTLVFNLVLAPGYPEAIQNMIEFNVDNGQTALVIGDTPFRLPATGTALSEYGNNAVLAVDNNDQAAVTYSTSLAMFYPSGFTNDNLGNSIVVPPSHMMLRTLINSDNKSYLWFAPAGTRRGTVDNASSVGFVEAGSGSFRTASLHQGLRDVMAGVKINPIATLPGVGLVNMGQYTRAQAASSLDRINVSRLVSYLRRQLEILAKPYLFEPNDSQTRTEVKAAVDALLTELVSQRALYDFLVVCDGSNNTNARIDRSELWIDIAIEPVKAVEFIYIPLRLLNTGEIATLSQ